MRTIERDIAGAFIFSSDGHVLIGKNAKGGVYEGSWVIPAGGIDPGETIEEALRREVMEEVGIDISIASSVEPIELAQTGKTEKTLPSTGERVLVDMRFFNFKVVIARPAAEIPLTLSDDLGHAEWVTLESLRERSYSPSVQKILEHLGCM